MALFSPWILRLTEGKLPFNFVQFLSEKGDEMINYCVHGFSPSSGDAFSLSSSFGIIIMPLVSFVFGS